MFWPILWSPILIRYLKKLELVQIDRKNINPFRILPFTSQVANDSELEIERYCSNSTTFLFISFKITFFMLWLKPSPLKKETFEVFSLEITLPSWEKNFISSVIRLKFDCKYLCSQKLSTIWEGEIITVFYHSKLCIYILFIYLYFSIN